MRDEPSPRGEERRHAARRAWIRFLRRHRPELTREPTEFVTAVLGYQFLPFHRRWWEFVSRHPVSMVLAPRGHGKSTILTVAFPLFRVLHDPRLRVLLVSNTAAQAQGFLREIRRQLETNPRLAAFRRLRGRPWNDTELNFSSRRPAKETTFSALGVMGPVISKHYDLLLLDDVVDESAGRSLLQRERLATWYYKELLPTLEPGGELHLIGTRYHYDDLYGRLLQQGIPRLVDQAISLRHGKETALWEEKFPLPLLRKKREEAGEIIFNTQYQNQVARNAGKIFRPEWIARADPPLLSRKFQGVDLALGRHDHHDYFAVVTIGEAGPGRLHVLAAYRARLSFEEQFQAVVSLFAEHDQPDSPVTAVGVEANAYQQALLQRLRSETSVPVLGIVQTRDKISRAMRLQGLLQTGRLTFPLLSSTTPAQPFLSALIQELLAFPDSPHDDLVDALEIAVRLALETPRYSELRLPDIDCNP